MFVWQTLVATPVRSFCSRQCVQAAQGAVEHVLVAAALVAHGAGAFDADQRRGVAELPQRARDLLGDELAVGEDLEIAVRMLREEVEQLRVHERLAAEDAEEAFPCSFASLIVRFSVSRSMALRGASTSTQQPWQRRLQEFRMER